MTNKKLHTNTENFRRYLKNEMTRKERNAFEKEIQRDPFAREALEGFESVGGINFENDLQQINERISPKQKRSKTTYWAAAASILLIITAGVIWMQLSDQFKSAEVAENKIIEKNETLTEKDEVQDNLIEEPFVDKTNEEQAKVAVNESQQKKIKEGKGLPEKEISNEESTAKSIQEEIKPVSPMLEETIAQTEKKLNVESVIEAPQKSSPIQVRGASRADNSLVDGVAFNNQQKKEFSTSDSNVAKELRVTNETMREETMIDTGRQVGRKVTTNLVQKNKKYKKAQPLIGMEAYEKYLDEEAILPGDYNKNKVRVKIKFTITEAGQTINFKNLNNANTFVFERATEIINEGPKWQAEISNGKMINSEKLLRITFQKK